MKKLILAMTAVCTAMVSSSLRAELNWGAGDYTPADWTPAPNNLLAGNKAAFAGKLYTESKCSEDPATVTDGIVPGASCDYKMIYGIADNSSLTWNLAEASDIESLRVFTRWGDGGRSGIGISSVQVWYDGAADWTTLEGSALSYQIKQSGSASLYGVLTNTNGRAIAENVIKLQVNFGTQDNNGTGYVEFEATEFFAPEKPVVRYGAVKSAMNRAMFSALVESCGEGAGSVSFKLAYAKHGETMPEATVVGVPATAGNALHYVLNDLDGGETYDYELVAVNDLAIESKNVLVGSFTVSSVLDIGPVTRPGLVQAKFGELLSSNVQPPLVSNLLFRTDCTLDYTYGAFMAHFTANGTDTYTNPYSGNKWGWNSTYSVFAYEGEVYLRKGEAIAVTGRYDDGSAAVVDGVSVFEQGNNSGYNSSEKNHAIYMAKADGWYPLNCWVWDWSGGKAVCQSYISGLQYNLNGEWANFTKADHWKPLNDTDGKGSFLRSVDRSTKLMQIAEVEQDGPTVNVTASFAGVPRESKFRAYTSTTGDHGDSPSAWTDFIEIATIQPGDTPSDTYAVANLANYPFVRFAIVVDPAAGPVDISKDPCTAYWQVSDLMQFETSGLTVLIASPTMTYTNGTVSVMVANMGDATSLDLTLEVATDAEFQDIISSQGAGTGVTSPGSRVMHIEDLEAATTYYARVKIVADGGDPVYTEVTELTTEAYPPAKITGFSFEKADTNLCSFAWSVSDFGDASESVSVFVQYADGEDFENATDVVVFEDSSADLSDFERAVVRGLSTSQAEWYRLKVVNSRGTVVYSDPVQATTESSATKTLIWANTGTDMNDPMSYVEQVLPTADDVIYFNSRAKTQPHLTADLTVRALHFCGYKNESAGLSPNDGYSGANYCGYVITAEEGAELTLMATDSSDNVQNSALAMFSTGTNVIDAAIYFAGGENQAHGIRVNGGVLDLVQSIRADGTDSQLRFAGRYEGRLRLGGDNSGFCGKCYLADTCPRFEFYNPLAIAGFNYYWSGHWGGGGTVCGKNDDKTVHFINGCSCPVTNLVAETYYFSSNDGQRFEGSPMCFPNLSLRQTGNDNGYSVDTTLTIRRVLRDGDGSLTIGGTNGGNFINLEGLFNSDGTAVRETSYVNVRGGCYVAMTVEGLGGLKVVHASSWGNSWPSMGLGFDWNPVIGKESTAGGNACGNDNGDRDAFFGWGAFGGDRTVTMFGDATRVVKCRESNDGVSFPGQIAFGSTVADGTLTLANSVDLNGGNRTFFLYDGSAFVDGRIGGDVISAKGEKFSLDGAGVLAIEGTFGNCEITKAGTGLLINGTRAGGYTAKSGTLVGGTGTVEGNFAVDNGATLRPGELGGTLTVKNGMVSLEGNPKVVIDIAADKNSCLAVESESAYLYKTDGSGAVTMEINLLEGAPESGSVKIMDWSNAVTGDLTNLFDPSSYVLTYDAEKISKATLTRDDEAKALYLNYESRKCGVGLLIIIR